MNETGRKMDVYIEYSESLDFYTVYADFGYIKIIESVEGVANVFQVKSETEYDIFIDPRYDGEIVIKNVKAAILCTALEG